MLRIAKLDVGYGNIQVLWDINIEVGKRQVVALIGANGAGKTTLIRAVSGMLKPKAGTITFDGKVINNVAPSDRVAAGILQVPEGRKLFGGMTVHENLVMGGYALANKQKVNDNLAYVYRLFPELEPLKKQTAETLSGGQQQMVAIGRALMGSPKLLLIDEFSLGLAPVVVERLAEAIREIQATADVAILMVEQDVALGLELSTQGYVLETGRMAMSGESSELIKNPVIRDAYLGL